MSASEFGELLRHARERKDWTQADVARVTGIKQQTVSRWEQGFVPPLETLALIAAALDLPLRTLAKYRRPSVPTLADRVREQGEFMEMLAEKAARLEKLVEELAAR